MHILSQIARVLTDAIVSPITPIPQPTSSMVVLGVGLSISATVLATFHAPAALDQKFVFGVSRNFKSPTTSSRASAPTKNVVTALSSYLKRSEICRFPLL